VARIRALAWARAGLVVGLQRGLLVLDTRRRSRRSRVLLAGLPVSVLAVSARGRWVWAAQGRWVWRRTRQGWHRLGRSPGRAWKTLVAHPVLRSVLLGSDGRAIYRSTDGGRTWRSVRVPFPLGRVVSAGFSMRGRRGRAAALMVLTRRLLLIRRSAFRHWQAPRRPRHVLGARHRDGADWVLGEALHRAVGARKGFQRIGLGPGGEQVLALSTDWRRRRGVWGITSRRVLRLTRRRIPARRATGCRWSTGLPAVRLPRPVRADWLPRLSLHLVGVGRLRGALAKRPGGPELGQGRSLRLVGFVTLRWPLDLSATTAEVSRQQAWLVRARWKRRERWKRLRLARCRHRRLRGSPTDALWVEQQTTKALIRWATEPKE
jgi:hypothetical protein